MKICVKQVVTGFFVTVADIDLKVKLKKVEELLDLKTGKIKHLPRYTPSEVVLEKTLYALRFYEKDTSEYLLLCKIRDSIYEQVKEYPLQVLHICW